MSADATCAPTVTNPSINPMERTIYLADALSEVTVFSARNSHEDVAVLGGGSDAVHALNGGSRSRGSKILVLEENG